MPTGTLTLPQRMIFAANSYAKQESLSIVQFFELLMNRQYGYKMTFVVNEHGKRASRVAISPRVHALRGVAKSDDKMSYRDIVADAVASRYEALG